MEKLYTIDQGLLADALALSNLADESDVIKLSLAFFVSIKLKKQQVIRSYFGELQWSSENGGSGTHREDIRAVT